MPTPGCNEHSFLLQAVLDDSKRRRKNIDIVWLDIDNAFGSIGHSAIFEILRSKGVPRGFIDMCREIYTGATHFIRTRCGPTLDIPVVQGIKQRCPLSPI